MFSETRNSPFPDRCICISPILCIQILCKRLHLYFYLDKHTHNEQPIVYFIFAQPLITKIIVPIVI